MKKTKKRAIVKRHSKPTKHIKKLLRLTPKFVHGMVAGAFVGVLLVSFLRAGSSAQALSISSSRDCTDNSVIYCGALSTAELQQKYHNAGVATIYSYFGITPKDIASIGTTAVSGLVYKDGTVTVSGKTVANDAITAGRENITPSTKVTVGGVTFYKRPPSVSFVSNSIAAYVVMNSSKQFSFAILASCGNPVTGTPVPVLKKPPPPPVKIAPPKPPVLTKTTTPTPATTASAITSLPNTGPGDVLIVAVLAVIGGYVFHMTHRHLTQKRRLATHSHRAKRRTHHAR